MKLPRLLAVAALTLVVGQAQAASLTFSIGVREASSTTTIGANGGATAGIEFIDLDLHPVPLDGNWHQVAIDLPTATVTAFAGATADGILSSSNGYGVLEMIRIRNTAGITAPIQIFLDDLVHTEPNGNATHLGWEGLPLATEHIFQEPNFSGSTAGNLLAGGTSLVTDSMAHTGSQSYEVKMQFVDATTTRWVRLTTFNTGSGGNPTIRLDAEISFWVKGTPIPEPASLTLAGIVACGLAVVRRRG
ncbi:MAG: PEP-CTERM sorting domain-containing protein [Pirellulales bacterium]|nr:PEP-CTERM sorting domain-containing protein [Pirellulales bacterium]